MFTQEVGLGLFFLLAVIGIYFYRKQISRRKPNPGGRKSTHKKPGKDPRKP